MSDSSVGVRQAPEDEPSDKAKSYPWSQRLLTEVKPTLVDNGMLGHSIVYFSDDQLVQIHKNTEGSLSYTLEFPHSSSSTDYE